MALLKVLASVALLLVLLATGIVLFKAPLYSRHSADECLQAYAMARTHTDTAHVDLLPYSPAKGPSTNRRCGEVRAVRADSAAHIVRRDSLTKS